MKYFWFVLLSFFLLNSCDDGDIIEDTFNFSTITVQKCSNSTVLYKINEAEALVFTTIDTNFPNAEGTKTLFVDGTNKISYKKFASKTSSSNICDTPTIAVLEEWKVTGGTIEIVSTKILDTNNPSKIVGYNHAITFKNITFNKSDGQLVYDNYVFGNYRTDVVDLNFNYNTATLLNCSNTNLLFKYNANNALLLDIEASLYTHHTVGTKTALINSTSNKVSYRVYDGGVNEAYFCQAIPPTSPALKEEWKAEDGVTDTSGMIVVETTQQTQTTFKHTIKLRKVTFKKGVLTYSPSPNGDYVFGEIIN